MLHDMVVEGLIRLLAVAAVLISFTSYYAMWTSQTLLFGFLSKKSSFSNKISLEKQQIEDPSDTVLSCELWRFCPGHYFTW